MKTNIIIFISLYLLFSCSSNINTNAIKNNKPILNIKKAVKTTPVTQHYIAVDDADSLLLDNLVNINVEKISLIDSITKAVTGVNVVAKDNNVVLNKIIAVRANQLKLKDYLKLLENITGYDLELINNQITISSRITKSWNLAAIASMPNANVSVVNKNNANNTNIVIKNDEWADVINNVKQILADDIKTKKQQIKQNLFANRRLGTITVITTPEKIKLVDSYLTRVISDSNKQIALEIKIYDVILNENHNTGIDFNLLSKGNNGEFGINIVSNVAANAAKGLTVGTLNAVNPLIKKDIQLTALLNILNTFGDTRIISEPFITLTNGMSSQFNAANAFRFVANIKANTDQNGNVVQTSELEDLEVGVQISLTARIIAKNKILIQVVPNITSLDSFTTITTGTGDNQQTFQIPNTTVQNLITQIIVNDGKTIVIGGLIIDKIADSAKKTDNKFFSFLDSKNLTYDRREVIMTIKPTILN